VKDAEHDYGVALMRICNDVRKPCDDQFPCTIDATRSSDTWMFGEHCNMVNDLKYGFGSRFRVGTAYVPID
jgi:hypothetical protein